jgi:hypothetical protein
MWRLPRYQRRSWATRLGDFKRLRGQQRLAVSEGIVAGSERRAAVLITTS